MKQIRLLSPLIALVLSACSVSNLSQTNALSTPYQPTTERMGNFNLHIPDGYCLNSKFSKRKASGVFALLHRCNDAAKASFYTVSIGPLNAGSISNTSEMRAFFNSDLGLASLATSGDAKKTKITNQRVDRDILYLQVTQADQPLIPLTDQTVWRSFFLTSGNIVAVTFHPLAAEKIPQGQSFRILRDYTRKLYGL